MAKRSNNRSNNSSRSTVSWLALFSFVAVMLLGLALMLSFIFSKLNIGGASLPGIIERIGLGIALIAPAVLSYREARKQSTGWFVLWVIAVILVVVFYILGFIL